MKTKLLALAATFVVGVGALQVLPVGAEPDFTVQPACADLYGGDDVRWTRNSETNLLGQTTYTDGGTLSARVDRLAASSECDAITYNVKVWDQAGTVLLGAVSRPGAGWTDTDWTFSLGITEYTGNKVLVQMATTSVGRKGTTVHDDTTLNEECDNAAKVAAGEEPCPGQGFSYR